MARYTDNWLSELYAKNDIVDVVGEHTALAERGGRYWGLCPFHNEKTPSFSVSRDKQLYYCFGCKKGGNVTHFVMETQNLSFPEAVEMLARRAHMEVPQLMEDRQYQKAKQKKRAIYEMNKIAAKYYFETLHADAGKKALAYLKKRGIEEGAVRRFGLGYAPPGWTDMADLLAQKGFSPAQIRESGLVSEKDGRIFDTFRDRVMFPIISVMGDVIGFGGRILESGEPKYLNTRETAAFNKRFNLYGLHLVRKMRNVKSVVLAEGYMDVVSLSAHGVKAAVASLGTALTSQQAALLGRHTKDVFVAYDGDEAGQAAALKALGVLAAENIGVRVVTFPEGMDPDDYIRKHGLPGFAERVKAAKSDIEYRLDIERAKHDIGSADGKEAYAIGAARILRQVQSPIRRERYAELVAQQTGYSIRAVEAQIGDVRKPETAKPDVARLAQEKPDTAQTAFLAAAISYPQAAAQAAPGVRSEDFESPAHQNIFSALQDSLKRGILPTYAELVSELGSETDRSEAARLAASAESCSDPMGYIRDCAAKMRREALKKQQRALKEALRGATGEKQSELLAKISELDKELTDKRV